MSFYGQQQQAASAERLANYNYQVQLQQAQMQARMQAQMQAQMQQMQAHMQAHMQALNYMPSQAHTPQAAFARQPPVCSINLRARTPLRVCLCCR